MLHSLLAKVCMVLLTCLSLEFRLYLYLIKNESIFSASICVPYKYLCGAKIPQIYLTMHSKSVGNLHYFIRLIICSYRRGRINHIYMVLNFSMDREQIKRKETPFDLMLLSSDYDHHHSESFLMQNCK
jgi:hypothetical protein